MPVSCRQWGNPMGGAILLKGVGGEGGLEEGRIFDVEVELGGGLLIEVEGVLRLKERLLLVKGILLC